MKLLLSLSLILIYFVACKEDNEPLKEKFEVDRSDYFDWTINGVDYNAAKPYYPQVGFGIGNVNHYFPDERQSLQISAYFDSIYYPDSLYNCFCPKLVVLVPKDIKGVLPVDSAYPNKPGVGKISVTIKNSNGLGPKYKPRENDSFNKIEILESQTYDELSHYFYTKLTFQARLYNVEDLSDSLIITNGKLNFRSYDN